MHDQQDHSTSCTWNRFLRKISLTVMLCALIVSLKGSIHTSVKTIISESINDTKSKKRSLATAKKSQPPRCALLFFGLPKLFESSALPSIKKYILEHNPDCDIFVHTYKIETLKTPRNKEEGIVKSDEVYLLTDNVMIETMDDFERVRDLDIYRPHHLKAGWGKCCDSTDNMIKQWHSINSVWNLMEMHGRKKQKALRESSKRPYYERVGLFRSDVLYLHPINIFDGDAVIPNFPKNAPLKAGVNDRMFYGLYDYAKIWATARFEFYDYYVTNVNYEVRSENYVHALLEHYNVPYDRRDVCFWRLRVNFRVYVQDCGVPGDRAEEHIPFIDGLICERVRKTQFACSMYVNNPQQLAYDESISFSQARAKLVVPNSG